MNISWFSGGDRLLFTYLFLGKFILEGINKLFSARIHIDGLEMDYFSVDE